MRDLCCVLYLSPVIIGFPFLHHLPTATPFEHHVIKICQHHQQHRPNFHLPQINCHRRARFDHRSVVCFDVNTGLTDIQLFFYTPQLFFDDLQFAIACSNFR